MGFEKKKWILFVVVVVAGVASFLGKRSMSFSGAEMVEEGNNGEDEFSDDGSQAGEKKRRLNMEQVKTLEKNFELGNKLEPERKMQLARALGLQPRQIAIWFQNRRARWKTKQLEKDYDLLKRQFEAIKSDNEALKSQNQKLQAEVSSKTTSLKLLQFFKPLFFLLMCVCVSWFSNLLTFSTLFIKGFIKTQFLILQHHKVEFFCFGGVKLMLDINTITWINFLSCHAWSVRNDYSLDWRHKNMVMMSLKRCIWMKMGFFF